MSRDTLVERKEHFLRQQKQILSQGITQSNRLSAIADQADIQEKVWIDVIRKGKQLGENQVSLGS
jgi:K+/H+ antiporter YhaU regulatory subunit KhtT